MTIKELKKELEKYPDDLQVGIAAWTAKFPYSNITHPTYLNTITVDDIHDYPYFLLDC